MSLGNVQRSPGHTLKNSLALLTHTFRQRPAWQWLIAGLVGVTLGVFTLGLPYFPSRWAPLFVLGVLCLFVTMIAGSARRLLLAIIILDIPLGLDINFAYRPDAAELDAIGGFSLSLTTICLIVLYALWLAELLARKRLPDYSRVWNGTTLALTAFVVITMLSVVVARDFMLSIYEIALLVQTLLLYIYVVATVRTRQDVLFVVTVLLAGLLLESIIMIGLRFVGHSVRIGGIWARIDHGTRVGGTVGSPNAAASYLSLSLALAVGVLLTGLGRSYKWLALLAFGLGGIALIFTLSRGGWNAFVWSMIVLYLLLAWRRSIHSLKSLLLTAGGLLVLVLLFQDIIGARLFSGEGSPPQTRLQMMRLAIKIIKDHPLLGVGANNFALMIPQYATPELTGWIKTVHNKYLLVWAETGLGGLVTFLLFLLTTIRRGWHAW
ncbi:MAG TPA: O-antigen ligase family protein, partial [Anaerolineae bacterium]